MPGLLGPRGVRGTVRRVDRRQDRRADNTAGSEEQTQPEASSADELKKLSDLKDQGVITQEEFDTKKKELLG